MDPFHKDKSIESYLMLLTCMVVSILFICNKLKFLTSLFSVPVIFFF